MPLIKSTSKQAFEKNIGREVRAGRPERQAVAIAYSEKREAGRKSHSGHTEEQGTQYESHVASTGARQPWHPTVVAATKQSDQDMD